MFTIELQTVKGGAFHCLFCGAGWYDISADQAVVLSNGVPADYFGESDASVTVICRECLQRDAKGRAALLARFVSRLRQRADALEALAAGLPAEPRVDWLRLVSAVLVNHTTPASLRA